MPDDMSPNLLPELDDKELLRRFCAFIRAQADTIAAVKLREARESLTREAADAELRRAMAEDAEAMADLNRRYAKLAQERDALAAELARIRGRE